MTNLTALNRINDIELDNVVGGTVGELDGLVSACAKNPVLKALSGAGSHVPWANKGVAKLVTLQLDNIGIKADIDLGWGGTGINSKHNTYIEKSTGKSLSQIEVEKRLERYAI